MSPSFILAFPLLLALSLLVHWSCWMSAQRTMPAWARGHPGSAASNLSSKDMVGGSHSTTNQNKPRRVGCKGGERMGGKCARRRKRVEKYTSVGSFFWCRLLDLEVLLVCAAPLTVQPSILHPLRSFSPLLLFNSDGEVYSG